ncbi:MAG: hypothetical protein JXO72_03690 [Vicinamibacteria bacterium]|nr:hypothetical protein [Vicinamibacteria bacterium]
MISIWTRTRFRREVSAGLLSASALSLAVLMAILPVLSLLHLSFASHQHRFNPTTGLYEDVIVVAGGEERDEVESCTSDRRETPALFNSRYSVNFTTCLAANLFILRYTNHLGDVSIARHVDDGRRQNAIYCEPQIEPIPVLSMAPKKSPPFFS